MRRLILTRHAKSSSADPAQRDVDRALDERGRRAAGLIGGWLKRGGYLPDAALVSSARRAQETWSGIFAVAGAAPTSHRPELYHAGPDALLAVLREPRDAACVLMLGHQPGIGAFARGLVAEPIDDADFLNFPTAATAVIDFDVEAWPEVGWATGELVAFAVPRTLE